MRTPQDDLAEAMRTFADASEGAGINRWIGERHLEVAIAAHKKLAREDLAVLKRGVGHGEDEDEQVPPHCVKFKTLRTMLAAVASGLYVGGQAPWEMSAYFRHLQRVIEAAAKDGD